MFACKAEVSLAVSFLFALTHIVGCARNPYRFLKQVFSQVSAFLVRPSFRVPLFHLLVAETARNFICFLEHQGTEVTFPDTGRGPAAKVTFVGHAGFILLNHAIGTGRGAFTAAGTFVDIDGNDTPLIFENGIFRAGGHAVSAWALKADTGYRIPLMGKIIDFQSGFRRNKHAFLDR